MLADGDISCQDAAPECFNGGCPVGLDNLLPSDLRILEIRGLLAGLHNFHLAERICNEYDVTRADLILLAEIEELLRELRPAKGLENG